MATYSSISNQTNTMIHSPKQESSQDAQAAVKVPAMLIMFLITLGFGIMPLKVKAFKENKMVLALSNAFSGGLFFAVGILHLLPEAAENFNDYYEEQDEKNNVEDVEHFPWAFLITVLSFTLILFIEKIATNHSHSHGSSELETARQSYIQNRSICQSPQDKNLDNLAKNSNSEKNNKQKMSNNSSVTDGTKNKLQSLNDLSKNAQVQINHQTQEDIEDQFNEQIVKDTLNIHAHLARSYSQTNQVPEDNNNQKPFDLTPYLLQVAVGIHALFEGIAIGIQTQWSTCMGIALAVIGHKWAEAMTLGISFRKANIPTDKATIMIAIQAAMNPLGVLLGWIMSNFGDLVTGIFSSISVGTFIYIACMEVIVEEFALKRYKWAKFGLFLVAIGFVCLLWEFEQLAGGG